jgi:D-lyxose ketol-isomerase
MISRSEYQQAQAHTAQMLSQASIILTPVEMKNIEVVDHGFGKLDPLGVQMVVYVNNERYCAKELVLFPRQTCPEHRHPPVESDPGKTETFRCRWGKLWLHMPGEPAKDLKAIIPHGSEQYFTTFHEIELNPGDQYTVPSNTLHWFQAGDEGAIVSEFSSTSRDETDIFTDPRIKRAIVIG